VTGKRSNKSGYDDRIGSWPRYSASKKGVSTLNSESIKSKASTSESEIPVVERIEVR
jgi:hypothetical protein